MLPHRQQSHQSRLVDQLTRSSQQYQDTLHQVTNFFVAHRNSLVSLAQAQSQAIQWIGQQVQASFLSYMDAFWVLMLTLLSTMPLALTPRNVKLGGAAHAGH